ncbi:MAG: hypothetical protein FD167_1676 [bacterium]|nr:MAG: hypothetical protein FD167_1676 [bacterium]
MSSLRQVPGASNSTNTSSTSKNTSTPSASASAFAGLGRVNSQPNAAIQQQNQNSQQGQSSSGRASSPQQDTNLLNGLLQNFGETIGLPDLELNDQNRCSLLLGDGDEAVQLTMELSPDGALCFYTILDKNTSGIPNQVKEYIANQPGTEDGTYLSLNSSGTTVFLCLSDELKKMNGLDFETLVRNFYSSANQWRANYKKLSKPMNASTALLNRPAAKDKKAKVERYIDKATGFLAIAYIIYRMGGVLA